MGDIGTREQVLQVIKQLQVERCAYSSSVHCDCKYGLTADSSKMGEQTGCPELRVVIHLLSVMDDFEYEELLEKPRAARLDNKDGR